MTPDPKIPAGNLRVLGQSRPGDRFFDADTGRWKKLKPYWPLIGDDFLVIRRTDGPQAPDPDQLLIPGSAEATGTPTQLFDDPMDIPQITIIWDDDNEEFRLMCTSYSRTEPAGERLFRKEPHPRVAFTHATRESAETDAATLTAYLATVHPKSAAQAKREEGKL